MIRIIMILHAYTHELAEDEFEIMNYSRLTVSGLRSFRDLNSRHRVHALLPRKIRNVSRWKITEDSRKFSFIERIYSKLNIKSRTEAVAVFVIYRAYHENGCWLVFFR